MSSTYNQSALFPPRRLRRGHDMLCLADLITYAYKIGGHLPHLFGRSRTTHPLNQFPGAAVMLPALRLGLIGGLGAGIGIGLAVFPFAKRISLRKKNALENR